MAFVAITNAMLIVNSVIKKGTVSRWPTAKLMALAMARNWFATMVMGNILPIFVMGRELARNWSISNVVADIFVTAMRPVVIKIV